MQRYFLEDFLLLDQKTIQVTGDVFHHITRVLRMNKEDKVYLVFQNEQSFLAKILKIETNYVIFSLLEKENQVKELPIKITIAHGFPKKEKLDLIIQKGTELGAYSIIAFPSDRSIPKWDAKKLLKKQKRLTKIAKKASEQSQRTHMPLVELLNSKQDLLNKFKNYDFVVVVYEKAAKKDGQSQLAQFLTKIKKSAKMLVIFGPEGGLSIEEVEVFLANKAFIVGLGPRILRAETAPLYFLSVISYELELRLKN
ncbi:MAG: 16S rRNA (uracil(1498)-N(3))-methyltransferase [Streptococcaceae bacterium]|nr:16S rRNA (uracil(1498)-N(3))-methyltransferase [Streptococcaceae bacterium]